MMWRHWVRWGGRGAMAGIVGFWLGGCAARGGGDEPIAMQLTRAAPELRGQRFSVAMDFESSGDLSFVQAEPRKAQREDSPGHTGRGSLLLPAGTKTFQAKIGKLVSAGALAGNWPLAGAWFYCEEPVDVTVSQRGNGAVAVSRQRTVHVPPRVWTAVFLDIQGITRGEREANPLEFAFKGAVTTPVRVDDVTVIDNTQTLVRQEGGWTVTRRGYRYVLDSKGKFVMELPTKDETSGWEVKEANGLRVVASGGEGKLSQGMTVYADGRSYWSGGAYRPVGVVGAEDGAYAAQHASPGEVSVPEEQGKVVRESAGDQNNDGYNESLGAYQLKANGPRLDITLTPQAAVLNPVFEITGLPAGKVRVTVEGKLVDEAIRLTDGRLLLRLPVRIERETTVNVRVQ